MKGGFMDFYTDFLAKYIIPNIAYILVFISICYIGTFIYKIATKKTFTYKIKNLIAFVLILGIGIYCLVTGNDITTIIH